MKKIFSISVFIVSLLTVFACSDNQIINTPESEESLFKGGPANSSIENPTVSLSKNNVIHRVSVGGADACEALGLPTGCDANFSLVAIMKADGSISGQWQDTFAGGGAGIHVAIDCMHIIDNGAVIGGEITHGTLGGVDVSGLRALTAVVDNGTSAKDPPDQISFSLIDNGAVCTDLIPDDFPLLELTHGQVKVR